MVLWICQNILGLINRKSDLVIITDDYEILEPPLYCCFRKLTDRIRICSKYDEKIMSVCLFLWEMAICDEIIKLDGAKFKEEPLYFKKICH